MVTLLMNYCGWHRGGRARDHQALEIGLMRCVFSLTGMVERCAG